MTFPGYRGPVRRRSAAILAAVGALSFEHAVQAQNAAPNDSRAAAAAVAPEGAQAPGPLPIPLPAPQNPDATEMPEVVVRGRAEDLLGVALSASQGAIGAADMEDLPLLRRGELLETVPGMVVTQHSGDGKANQYFLRGFNLDHGTDFAFSVDGVPVNLPSHAHGQGYSDLNFVIPELVDYMDFKKGPFYAEVGDFSGSGAADIHLVNTLRQGTLNLQGGEFGYVRALAAASPVVGPGTLLYAFEYNHYNGPWVLPESSNRFNGLLRYHWAAAKDQFNVTAGVYAAPEWHSTDQVAQRARCGDTISRFGSLDPTDGGNTGRGALSFNWTRNGDDSVTRLNLYGFYYRLNLFSNFTYFLVDPVNGDQFEQIDRRYVGGGDLKRIWDRKWFGKSVENTIGVQLRNDYIPESGLDYTADAAGDSRGDQRPYRRVQRRSLCQQSDSVDGLAQERDRDPGRPIRHRREQRYGCEFGKQDGGHHQSQGQLDPGPLEEDGVLSQPRIWVSQQRRARRHDHARIPPRACHRGRCRCWSAPKAPRSGPGPPSCPAW